MIQKSVKSQVETQPPQEQVVIQLIVFLAGDEEFGVPIEVIREIIKMGQITPIPASPGFIKGIINVRGEIVTTVDIRLRFSLHFDKDVEPKHIIVTKQEDGLFGLVVDEVIEVLRIHNNDIQPPPKLITQIHEKYVKGVVTHNDRLIILLDLSQVLSKKELIQFSQHGKKEKKQGQKTIDAGQMLETANEILMKTKSSVNVKKTKSNKRRTKQ